jgi:hypothetical protein
VAGFNLPTDKDDNGQHFESFAHNRILSPNDQGNPAAAKNL